VPSERSRESVLTGLTISKTPEPCDGFSSAPPRSSELRRSRRDLLSTLFSALDSHQVRYCVLHSWEELPHELSSDLDIAVHPEDERKLALVFRFLRGKGYAPVQAINYALDAHCFRFLWHDDAATDSLAVDVIFKHQKGVLVTPSAKLLISGRRRLGAFWIPAPESEFTYLLARRTWKGTAPPRQARRLKALVAQLGQARAQRLAAELFFGRLSVRIVEACSKGQLNSLLARIKWEPWKTSLVRNPFGLMANLLFDGIRRIRRWAMPTGLFITLMGPDGVGKSTLIKHLVEAVGCVFDRHRLFHWRPMLLWQQRAMGDATRPHSAPRHGCCLSVARIFAHLLDYWLGYWLVLRPLLARSGLVVFDRYFDDVLIDPKRYRYGGPLWLVRIVRHLIPEPDMVLILDAPDEMVLSRKQEIELAEIQRQRRLYVRAEGRTCASRVINASGSIPQVTAEAVVAVIEHLARRFECQNGRWLTPDR
jgi:thymidylate kinase